MNLFKNPVSYFYFFCLFSFASEDISIQTSSGIVDGVVVKKVITWHDIPYAKPPVGDLRWHAPRDIIQPNFKILDQEDNFCVQRPSNLGGADGDGDFTGTEDCLYLDIRAPHNKSDKKLPVMFWIHGGGNTSGLKDIYDFSGLVQKQNVIVVSINYRLGPFGWFSHPAIQDHNSGIDKTSNFGTLDIIKALEWVNLNIEKFGGDKNNITIFGESAGGHNVFSLLVAPQAKGLFHKAISQSGYTTSNTYQTGYLGDSSNVEYISTSKIVTKLLASKDSKNIRSELFSANAYDIYKQYDGEDVLSEMPLLTNDGIVIPKTGLAEALKNPVNKDVPVIAGSNRDEVKLWIGTALYFVKPEYSFFGSIIGVPRIKIVNEDAFEAFNYYRSSAWQLRGVKEPLDNLAGYGYKNLYAYRYDWDDHRRWPVANFKKIIGAAHATEIPLIAGNNKLVGDYGFLIYPRGFSKSYTSKNMMNFWANFAKFGAPGESTNGIIWNKYNESSNNFIILDKKKNLQIKNEIKSFDELLNELSLDDRVNAEEKCVILYQMGSLIGNDIYEDLKSKFNIKCSKESAKDFLRKNASYVSY
jgi:para-nitrobenzyl esterase